MAHHPYRRARIVSTAVAVTGLVTLGLISGAHSAPLKEYIENGTFADQSDPWWATSEVALAHDGERLCGTVRGGTATIESAVVGYNGVPLVRGTTYTLTFTATSSTNTVIRAVVQRAGTPYTPVLKRDTALTPQAATFTYRFTPDTTIDEGSLVFQLGGSASGWTFCLDDVSLTSEDPASSATTTTSPAPTTPTRTPGTELIRNGTFAGTSEGWFASGTTTTQVIDGRFCSATPGNLAYVWDASIGQNNLTFVSGETYTVSFTATASPASSVRVVAQVDQAPYTSLYASAISLTPTAQTFSFSFTATENTTIGQFAIQVGSLPKGALFCVDDVSLKISQA